MTTIWQYRTRRFAFQVATLVATLSILEATTPVSAISLDCRAPQAQVRIDHVVIAVSQLPVASRTFEALGFTLKDGRLHANGLRNQHVKFQNGTALELMTVDGEGGDELARHYEEFIIRGEGGAYLAFSADYRKVLGAAEDGVATATVLNANSFRYVTFENPGLEDVFFVEYMKPIEDEGSVLQHKNGAEGIAVVWLEASGAMGKLLLRLGASQCENLTTADGQPAVVFGVANGTVVITEAEVDPPRVNGVQLTPSENTFRYGPKETHGILLTF